MSWHELALQSLPSESSLQRQQLFYIFLLLPLQGILCLVSLLWFREVISLTTDFWGKYVYSNLLVWIMDEMKTAMHSSEAEALVAFGSFKADKLF